MEEEDAEEDSTVSSLDTNNLIESIEFSDDDFELFSNKLQHKINKIDDEKMIALHKLNTEISTLMISIHDKQEEIQSEIELFYTEKKNNLKHVLSYIERLYKNRKKISDKILKRDFTKMIENVKYYADNLMRKKGIFQKSESLNNIEIGCLKIPNYEKPIKEICIKIDKKLNKIISNNSGFYYLKDSKEIIELQTEKIIYRVDGKIDDISLTYDNEISYMQLLKSTSTVSIIKKPFYSLEYYTIQKQIRKKKYEDDTEDNENNDIKNFAVLKDFILIYKRNCLISRNKKTNEITLIPNNTDFDERFQCHFIDNNYLYDLNDNKFTLWNFEENDNRLINYKELIEGEDTFLRKIIDYLNNGYNMLCNKKYIYLINKDNQLIFRIEMKKIFPNERVLNYRRLNQQIIFCLTCLDDKCKIIFKYYPINFNYKIE